MRCIHLLAIAIFAVSTHCHAQSPFTSYPTREKFVQAAPRSVNLRLSGHVGVDLPINWTYNGGSGYVTNTSLNLDGFVFQGNSIGSIIETYLIDSPAILNSGTTLLGGRYWLDIKPAPKTRAMAFDLGLTGPPDTGNRSIYISYRTAEGEVGGITIPFPGLTSTFFNIISTHDLVDLNLTTNYTGLGGFIALNNVLVQSAPKIALSLDKPAYNISAGPLMPEIKATAKVLEGSTPNSFSWTYKIHYNPKEVGNPGGPDINLDYGPFTEVTSVPTFIPKFSGIAGGELSMTVSALVNGGNATSDPQKATILGSNPSIADIKVVLGDNHVLWRMCSLENNMKQFTTSGYPAWNLHPGDGGVGLMQRTLSSPTPSQLMPLAWNWKSNAEAGRSYFRGYCQSIATRLPGLVQNSTSFISLVKAYNAKRLALGKLPLAVTVPSLKSGDFLENPGEFEREAVRVYNGAVGRDLVLSRPLQEYTLLLDNSGILALHVYESTLKGVAIWRQVLPGQRPSSPGDPSYVGHVINRALP